MDGKDGPMIVINVDTTQLDEAIAKVQKLLDMLYEVQKLLDMLYEVQKLLDTLHEVDSLAPGMLQGGDANAKQD